jgi:hypothetical protein
MISATYGRVIRRYEGAPPLALAERFRAGKVEAVSLLAASFRCSKSPGRGGVIGRGFRPAVDPRWVIRWVIGPKNAATEVEKLAISRALAR